MNKVVAAALMLLSVGACQHDSDDNLQPEYADWYALRAPDARAIEGVYGDIDGKLVITTGYAIYQTTDRGKTWRTSNYSLNHGLFGFAQRQDTLLALSSELTTSQEPNTAYAASPSHYSLDQGLTWQPYLYRDRQDYLAPRVARNRATAPSGTEYSIDYQDVITPGAGGVYVETVGVKTSTGYHLHLPQEHQLTSLYLDAKSRLYVTGSAPLCGQGKDFAFCGEQNGVLYVSKKALP